jgi:RNA polymerase sigma-70 factor (ECF subfamily)
VNQPDDLEDALPRAAGHFATTHWTAVMSAGRDDSSHAFRALSELCEVYWYPLYAYVRRRGYERDEALDLTQEFFARLLKGESLGSVDRRKGKFRSFLLASMNHFLAKEWTRANRQKRGGGCAIHSLQDHTAERLYLQEAATHGSPDALYERRWAMTMLETALDRLQEDYEARGKAELYHILKGFLSGNQGEERYAGIAERIGMTEGAVKVAVHRMRARYGEILHQTITETVGSPEEVDEEIQNLHRVLGRAHGT